MFFHLSCEQKNSGVKIFFVIFFEKKALFIRKRADLTRKR